MTVVTGGARGIGRAIAEAFVEAGAAVALADIDADQAAKTAAALAVSGRCAIPLPLDVRDVASVRQAAARVEAAFGRVDVLVNSAGIARNSPAESTDVLQSIFGPQRVARSSCLAWPPTWSARTTISFLSVANPP